jgi:hypothetical protein
VLMMLKMMTGMMRTRTMMVRMTGAMTKRTGGQIQLPTLHMPLRSIVDHPSANAIDAHYRWLTLGRYLS